MASTRALVADFVRARSPRRAWWICLALALGCEQPARAPSSHSPDAGAITTAREADAAADTRSGAEREADALAQSLSAPDMGADAAADVEHGARVEVLDAAGQPTSATLWIGAAGLYPPVQRRATPQAPAILPKNHAGLIGGGAPTLYSILTRGDDGALAAWADVGPDAQGRYVVQLVPAAPLSVRITRADGSLVPGARVSVQRERVDLTRQQATSDARGVAQLGTLPPGLYAVTVAAPGHLRVTQQIAHTRETPSPAPHTIALAPARQVSGRVVDALGQGIRGAVVTAHLDRWGEPTTLDVRDLERVRKLATVAWEESDPAGTFSVQGLPAGVVYLTVVAPGFVPRLSGALDLRQAEGLDGLTIALQAGRSVQVRVQGEDGTAAAGAEVTWSDRSGAQGHAMTDVEGMVRLTGLPPSAQIAAALDRWTASATPLDARDSLTLTLRPPGQRRELRLRFQDLPEGVRVTGLSALGADGGACQAQRLPTGARRDWRLLDCSPGRVTLTVQTAAHGSATVETQLEDTQELTLPAPTPVTLEVVVEEHKPALRWRERGLPTTLVQDTPGASSWWWRGALYPGRYGLSWSAEGGAYDALSAELTVGQEATHARYVLRAITRREVLVADRRSKPMPGAYVVIWDGEQALDTQVSQAGGIATLRAPKDAAVVVAAFSPRDGEGMARGSDSSRLVVSLDQPSHALRLPGRVLDRDELGRRLGAPLVEDSGGLRVDVTDPKSAAAQGGIPRGAYLLLARRVRSGLELVICDTQEAAPRVVTLR